MTIKFNNVYVLDTSTLAGPIEEKGPLKNLFDRTFSNFYNKEKTWEQAEIKSHKDSINVLLNKSKKEEKEVDLIISGDLLNQITPSSYAASNFNIPFLGIYGACSTYVEGMIIASTFLENKKANNIIVSTSSHNLSSEKQFRNPTEYGFPKPKSATFTATGAASILLTNKKTNIKLTEATIGKAINYGQTDTLNLGSAMVISAADTIYNHLKKLNKKVDDYDLILTGDLGKYGKEVLKDYMLDKYGINLTKNYDDCGTILYDLDNQTEVLAGGSGPVCSALVTNTIVMEKLKNKELKKVLVVATGALFSPTMIFQHEKILSIAHAISLEVE